MKNRLDIWEITWYYSLATAEDSRCLKERKNTFYADAYRGKIDTKV